MSFLKFQIDSKLMSLALKRCFSILSELRENAMRKHWVSISKIILILITCTELFESFIYSDALCSENP